ncbi:MAG: hypothetical protein Q9190_003510 [Brigantiaea leucoxantha]
MTTHNIQFSIFLLFPLLAAAIPTPTDPVHNQASQIQDGQVQSAPPGPPISASVPAPAPTLITNTNQIQVVAQPAALGIYQDNNPDLIYGSVPDVPGKKWVPWQWWTECEEGARRLCNTLAFPLNNTVNDIWVWDEGKGKCQVGAWIPKSYGIEAESECKDVYLDPMWKSMNGDFTRASVNVAEFPTSQTTGQQVDPGKPSYLIQGLG